MHQRLNCSALGIQGQAVIFPAGGSAELSSRNFSDPTGMPKSEEICTGRPRNNETGLLRNCYDNKCLTRKDYAFEN